MKRERKRLADPSHPSLNYVSGDSLANKVAADGKVIRVKYHVLGAAGEVTGSLNLFEVFYERNGKVVRFILDVGLDQENDGVNRALRLPAGITAADIDFVVISHAHIDHSGWLPKLIKDGFKGTAYTHPATRDLMEVLLPDSGHLQEAAAARLNKHAAKRAERSGKSQAPRQIVLPSYTEEEGSASVKCVKGLDYNEDREVAPQIWVKLTEACHILGSAVVTVTIGTGKERRIVTFTGNVGRPGTTVLRELAAIEEADYVISESTYGNKLHEKRDRLESLAAVIKRAYKRAKRRDRSGGCGVIIIPAFAIGRVQAILYDLRTLMEQKRIPNIPVFLDSPMAIKATRIYRKHRQLYNAEAAEVARHGDPFKTPAYVECENPKMSAMLDKQAKTPIIIIGSSGMAAGGRIRQHIKVRLPSKRNTIIFVGHQESGVLGHTLVNDRPNRVRIGKALVKCRAVVDYLSDYSGHADYSEIIHWMKLFKRAPKRVFLVHGDTEALAAFKGHIERELGWSVEIPARRQCFEL